MLNTLLEAREHEKPTGGESTPAGSQARLPLWLKLAYTGFVAALVPTYWVSYGPVNFLWICDVALLLTVPALWLENRFLASMQAVAVLALQLLWIVDFLIRLVAGVHVIGLTDYMFDANYSIYLRGLSSFHGWLPILLVWMVWRLGYDRKALAAQTLLGWTLLLVCFFFTPPPPAPANDPGASVNVNWVFGPSYHEQQTWMPAAVYLALLMVFYPVCVFLPAHLLLGKLSGHSRHRRAKMNAREASNRRWLGKLLS